MRVAQLLELLSKRSENLVKVGERDVGLELDTGGAQDLDPAGPRPFRSRIQEHRLADPRLAGQQHRVASGGGPIEELADQGQLTVPSDQ